MGAIASQTPASRLLTQSIFQTQIKENIKALRRWPLCGEFTADRWIPCTNGQLRENVSIWWRHHGITNTSCVLSFQLYHQFYAYIIIIYSGNYDDMDMYTDFIKLSFSLFVYFFQGRTFILQEFVIKSRLLHIPFISFPISTIRPVAIGSGTPLVPVFVFNNNTASLCLSKYNDNRTPQTASVNTFGTLFLSFRSILKTLADVWYYGFRAISNYDIVCICYMWFSIYTVKFLI